MTSYTTYAEVYAHTGTPLTQSDVEILIVEADRKINKLLRKSSLIPDYTDENLMSAGLAFTKALVAMRHRMDGRMPNSISVGGMSMSDNIDSVINLNNIEGESYVAVYVEEKTGRKATEMLGGTRVDRDMDEFKLDPNTIAKYDGDGSVGW